MNRDTVFVTGMAAEIRRLQEREIEPLIEELWFPFAEEMASIEEFNELADDIRADAIDYRREQFDDENVRLYVALEEGQLVGMASAKRTSSPPIFVRGDAIHLKELYVAPEHRRTGIGSALLGAIKDWATAEARSHLTLSVEAQNEAALAFYQSHGFEIKRHKMAKQLEE
ncbi:MAG: GNAT family N-acetyltransferase [Halobacteriales archaeon]|nr:GNAT family N-acetyltransferase [Halobacteriales archaeon]